jgi:ClpP class serine protease
MSPVTACPFPRMGDDAWRPMIEQLRHLGHVETLDVFIYSRGGAIDVPWRLNNAFRQVADRWNALIPFRANSAATLLSLGADKIILGPQAELGPIDPPAVAPPASPKRGSARKPETGFFCSLDV